MTANDWRDLLVGAGSVLEIGPAPTPPLDHHRMAATRATRVRRLLDGAAKRVRSAPPSPSADEYAQQLAERVAARLDAETEHHPQCDRIRREVGPLRPLLVFRGVISLPVVGG